MNFQVERLRRLPRRSGETWQGGIAQMPMWVQEPGDRKPWRPWIAGWASPKVIRITQPQRERNEFDMVLKSLADLACDPQMIGCRPATLQVREPALAEYLRAILADLHIEVEIRDELPAFDDMLGQTAEHFSQRTLLPDSLAVKGVTVESMRAFAEAAAEFYGARPWEFLSHDDLIAIELPAAAAGLGAVAVLGADGGAPGLGFYESAQEFANVLENPARRWRAEGGHWSVLFGPIMELSFGDGDLWLEHKLPVADEHAYPMALCHGAQGKDYRPGPDVLAFFEGLLRALAQTAESEVDAGRWRKQVGTRQGPTDFVLALPFLLERQEPPTGRRQGRRPLSSNPLAIERFMPRGVREGDWGGRQETRGLAPGDAAGRRPEESASATPLEQAKNLVYDAYNSVGRQQLQLARRALETCPDCADAYALLAERAVDPDRRLEYYTQALQAAERTLDPDIFEKEAGRFWGLVETRPYMRARFGLAACLERLGRLEEAAGHYDALLRLNPNDNQNVRFHYWPCLLMLGQDDRLHRLLKRYQDDRGSCFWDYPCALLAFRMRGEGGLARKHLREALDHNESAAHYLMGEKPFPRVPPDGYTPGSVEEGILCASLLVEAWRETPGAVEWLATMVGQS
jgi:tetratricopeptide (TPR) repeat protein